MKPIERQQNRKINEEIEKHLILDEQAKPRFTSEEILEHLIVQFPWFKESLYHKHQDWMESRKYVILKIQRINQRMRKAGYPVGLKEQARGKKPLDLEKVEPETIVSWFRIQKNIDKLSWNHKEEIVGALGVKL
jgi:hypothetical protein